MKNQPVFGFGENIERTRSDSIADALAYIETNPGALESRIMSALISDYETALYHYEVPAAPATKHGDES